MGENEERHCAVVCVCRGGPGPTLLSEKMHQASPGVAAFGNLEAFNSVLPLPSVSL